jgi:hypothetical protein
MKRNYWKTVNYRLAKKARTLGSTALEFDKESFFNIFSEDFGRKEKLFLYPYDLYFCDKRFNGRIDYMHELYDWAFDRTDVPEGTEVIMTWIPGRSIDLDYFDGDFWVPVDHIDLCA